jgi:hypothetical protein
MSELKKIKIDVKELEAKTNAKFRELKILFETLDELGEKEIVGQAFGWTFDLKKIESVNKSN